MSLNVRDVDLTGGTGRRRMGGGGVGGWGGNDPTDFRPKFGIIFRTTKQFKPQVLLNFIKVNLRNVCFRWLCADLSLKLFWRFAVEG